MVDNLEINNLAVNAKNGCEKSKETLLNIFLCLIYKESEIIWYKIKNFVKFEEDCLNKINWSIANLDEGNIRSFYWMSVKTIRRVRNDHLKRNKRDHTKFTSIEAFKQKKENEDKEYIFEVEDVLADVEQEVLLKEKVALLAEGDSRKLAIINEWIKGCYSDTDIAELLAQRFGGKSESHRKYIQRFRSTCQTTLASAV
jgi:hypothetical protein